MPLYAVPSGSATPVIIREGFDSPSINHYHFQDVAGKSGRTVVKERMCRECYFEDYKLVYPDSDLVIDDLPKIIQFS